MVFVNQQINNYTLPEPNVNTSYLFVLVLMAFLSASSFGISIKSQNSSSEDSLKIIEKAYLHTDRAIYYSGDDIWFKAYLICGSDRLLSDHSNNLHVELISPSLEIIDSRIIKIEEGLGNGDFHLPDNLESGLYRVRAYTNYMRNFDDQLFFNKNITIINPKDASKAFSDSSTYNKNKLDISFFPEGGSLVDNVPCMVAFKAVNAFGEGCDVAGEVYSSKGDIVTTFKSTHKGMGLFALETFPGLSYYAIAKNQYGNEVRSEIPKSFSTGIALSLYRNKDNELVATFKTNPETLPQILDRDLPLTVSAHSIVINSINIKIGSLNNFFILPFNDLPDGIYSLTLSRPDSIPLCERLVYIQNNDYIKFSLETDKTVYNQRDSVSVKLSLSGNYGIAPEAFLSLSATKNIASKSLSQFPSTISSWFLLESDVRGPIEEPSYYFDPSNPNRLNDLDLLLLTQGWRDFKWKYKNMSYPPETGFTISGRIRKKFADAPLKNSKVNIAIFKSGNPVIRTVPADTSGRFCLEGVDMMGDAKLVVSSVGENKQLKGWVILDSLKYPPAKIQDSIVLSRVFQAGKESVKYSLISDNDPIAKESLPLYIQYAEIKNSIQKKFKLSDTINPGEVNIVAKRSDAPESARTRSQHYLLALFPDYEYKVTPQSEIFNNLGRLIAFRLHMHSGNMSGLAFNNPIVLLDGMDVGWDGIAYLPIDWIERFDGIRPGSPAAMVWGERGKGGVISVITRTRAPLSTFRNVYHSANIRFSGYNEPRIFYSPTHHSTLESDYKPDLRTTLFWEPYIKVENNKDFFLNYFNADNPSNVKVIVEGITSTGIPVTEKIEYEVK